MDKTEQKGQWFPSMTNERALEVFQQIFEEEEDVWAKAQLEYAASKNIFANFNRAAQRLKITPEQALMVYAIKHMDGIISWTNGHQTQREKIEGRIADLRIYLLLLHQMVIAYEEGAVVDAPEKVYES